LAPGRCDVQFDNVAREHVLPLGLVDVTVAARQPYPRLSKVITRQNSDGLQ
jgi:hypothetical protein